MSTTLTRAGLAILAVAFFLLADWRIITTYRADRLANNLPQQALVRDTDVPAAWLALAQKQLDARQPQAAAASARKLLAKEPLAAQAFVILARAAQAQDQQQAASLLYDIAARRAPRDQHTRAWIIGTQLQHGQFAKALDNMAVLLRIAPPYVKDMVPLMAKLAAAPKFASALGNALAAQPSWRYDVLHYLLAHADHDTVDHVFSATQQAGGLTTKELSDWLAYLGRAGLWGEAYSRWVSALALPSGTPLTPIFNGSFERQPNGIGFGWRLSGAPGAIIERVAAVGTDGRYAVRAMFLGRRVPNPGFTQTLFLPPGARRLQFRVQASDLHSDKGLQWRISCVDGTSLAVSQTIEGSFAWQTMSMDFDVSAQNCPAQTLALINPGADGAGKIVNGTLWFDDFKLTSLRHTQAPIH